MRLREAVWLALIVVPFAGSCGRNGALYGTTVIGGRLGYGNVFELTPAGSGYTESVLHTFRGGSDARFHMPA